MRACGNFFVVCFPKEKVKNGIEDQNGKTKIRPENNVENKTGKIYHVVTTICYATFTNRAFTRLTSQIKFFIVLTVLRRSVQRDGWAHLRFIAHV